ncbi:hypothetical protein ACGFMK_02745 [Amycolatopsis sp. NPDC049252]|uniref:hypothetical protein n=1 Tax=Amycolatopsis sp. NPDC049252 TaxID=3363933 RepID=UPI003716BB65
MSPDAPAGLAGGTVVQLPVKPGLVGLYLGNVIVPGHFEPHRVQGFAGRAEDVAELDTAAMVRNYGLAKIPGWGPLDELYLLKFPAGHTFPFRTSYGASDREIAAELGVARVYPPPFLGTGYFPGVDHPLPEYVLRLVEIPVGAELWVHRADDAGTRLGQYHSRKVGWIPEQKDAFGEATFFPPPVSLPPLVRRGYTARYRGGDFDAEFAGPGRVVLHPLPGAPAPADFGETYGFRMKAVDQVELDELTFVRTLCRWRGGTFEILGRTRDAADLILVDEDFLTARDLGLSEVDYRVWRQTVPAAELTDFRTEAVPVPLEGQFQ